MWCSIYLNYFKVDVPLGMVHYGHSFQKLQKNMNIDGELKMYIYTLRRRMRLRICQTQNCCDIQLFALK